MRTNVVGRHMEITPAIEQMAVQKSSKLTSKYDDFVQQLDFTIEQVSANKGQYQVELLVAVRGHPELVAKAHGTDVYALIDDVVAKAERQLQDHKEKLKLEHR